MFWLIFTFINVQVWLATCFAELLRDLFLLQLKALKIMLAKHLFISLDLLKAINLIQLVSTSGRIWSGIKRRRPTRVWSWNWKHSGSPTIWRKKSVLRCCCYSNQEHWVHTHHSTNLFAKHDELEWGSLFKSVSRINR